MSSSPDGFDVDLATEVQQLLFPKSSPVCTWCCIGVHNRMAVGLGGDFFDFIKLRDGSQVLVLGDVTGHGLHASLVMALLYGFIHRAAENDCRPLKLIREVNDFLQSFANRSPVYDHYFSATLFFGRIDPDDLTMEYVNAGHVQPMVRGRNGVILLEPTAPPIGFLDDPQVEVGRFRFEPSDRLLLYTDGLVEAPGREGLRYGRKRLKKLMEEFEGDHLELLERISGDQTEFGCCDPPVDDCTAIVMDFHPPRGGEGEQR